MEVTEAVDRGCLRKVSTLKLVYKFIYLGNSVSLTETNINTRLAKAWTARIGYRSYGSQTWPIKWNAVSSMQRSCRYCYMDALHGRYINGWRKSLTATTQECCEQYWTGPGGNTAQSSSCTGTNHPIMKTIQIWRTRHTGHCWRSRDELISDILLWTHTHGRAKAGRPART